MNDLKNNPQDTIQVFKQCGACSHTFGHLLNRAFGHKNEEMERALDPLAGGIMNQGQQCGMLWGAAMAVGAEAFRQHKDPDEAIAVAIAATRHIMGSFKNRTNSVNCRDIIGIDLSKVWGLVRFVIQTTLQGTRNNTCYHLAEQWAPEAIQSAREGLSATPVAWPCPTTNCATELAKRMGASEEESTLVAGFAGGLGLSGHACGALSVAIWIRTLQWCREHPGKTPPYFNNPLTKRILKAFYGATDGEIECSKIVGRQFEGLEDHATYIQEGGCKKVLEALETKRG